MAARAVKAHAVYAVVGKDRFLRDDAVSGLLDALASAMDDMGPTRFEGSEAVLAEVLDEVRTLSLLGGRRIAIVEEADAFITAHRKPLERYCAEAADTGSLILSCNALAANTRLHKIIADQGSIIRCEMPKGRAVVGWIQNRAKSRYGKSISAPAAGALREQIGDAPGLLDSELAKLTAYVAERPEITAADIGALTGRHREEKVFAVIDAVSEGDAAAALRNWEQVLATDRSAPARAIAGLAWGVRRLLEAHRSWSRGTNLFSLARSMYTDAAILERRLERTSMAQLEQQQRDLLSADLAVKTGASQVNSAVEKFIVKHCVQSRDARPTQGRVYG